MADKVERREFFKLVGAAFLGAAMTSYTAGCKSGGEEKEKDDKTSCKGKDSCKGKEKDSCKGKEKDSCKGKDSCKSKEKS